MISNPDLSPEPEQLFNLVHKNNPSYFNSTSSNNIKKQALSICKHCISKIMYKSGPLCHSYKTLLLEYFDFFFFFLDFFLYFFFYISFLYISFFYTSFLCITFFCISFLYITFSILLFSIYLFLCWISFSFSLFFPA